MTRSSDAPEVSSALARCRGGLVAVGAFSFLINLLVLAGPLYMMLVYDRALASASVPTLVALSALLGGLFLAMGLLTLIRARILLRLGNRLDAALSERACKIQLRAEGGPTRHATADLSTLRDFLGGQTPGVLFDAPWTPVFVLFAFLLHPLLGLIAAGGAVVLIVLGLLNDLATRRVQTRAAQTDFQAATLLSDAARQGEAVAAMRMDSAVHARWAALHGEAVGHHARANDRSATVTTISRTFRMTLQSVVLGTGVYLAIQGVLSPGAIIAASVIVARGLAPAEQAIGSWRQLVSARAAHRRLREAFAESPVEDDRIQLPKPAGRIEARGLTTHAGESRRPLLRAVSLHVPPGEFLAVIGQSGSGKSSLARALVGAQAPAVGTVRLDGASLAHWRPAQLGAEIGYLPQSVELFDGTVRENIARFLPAIDDEAVLAAAQMAGAHETILRLPQGYETRLGAGAARLSGGERQRIGLARALYADPALLVLDEPNAHLDGAGEAALAAALDRRKAAGRTIVVIAHRPSAIARADRVLVMENGAVSMIGTPQEVLRHSQQGAKVGGRKVVPMTAGATS
ncbi:MAG: type I secretion system permease/ATPase [Pseudomonadota bacterium]